jgi:hypothetical protein
LNPFVHWTVQSRVWGADLPVKGRR